MTPRRTATRDDVAKLAGVSTAVVSYVMNNGPKRVGPERTQRVLDAVEQLGYAPNLMARALASGSTKLLGLVLPDWGNPFFTELTQEITLAAAARNHAVVITNSGEDVESERLNVAELEAHRVDGLLISTLRSAAELSAWAAARAGDAPPVVLLNCERPIAAMTGVGSTFADGAAEATEHLLGHGHQQVAFVTGAGADEPMVGEREAGWRRAHLDAGRDPGAIARSAYTREGGYRSGLEILQQAQRPTAIFAVSDLVGVGVLRAAHELGLRVPEDLAVVAFDGSREVEFSWPPLTAIKQPVREMAVRAVSLLLDGETAPEFHRFKTELVIRRSCGCTP